MAVDDATVDRIASLAKLAFDDEAKAKIKEDLSKMLDFVGKLNELNTDDVAPLIYMLDEPQRLREDIVTEHVSQKDALKNAPDKDTDYFRVPKVIKK
ncbi:MAG: Asp-tRNA(Asn)/Glu-tRNA(Gln) amidotransferase subunit GatC [Vicingaceae bacterium]